MLYTISLVDDVKTYFESVFYPKRQRLNSWLWHLRLFTSYWIKRTSDDLKVMLLRTFSYGKLIRDTIAEGAEGAQQLGLERARVYSDLLPKDNDRFVTAVKLNRGLRDSNYDQLYAYLKQHEAHANENKMITSSNTRNQATVQDDRVVVQNGQGRQNRGQGNNARNAGAAGYKGAQNRVGNANPSQARQIKCYNCNGGQDNATDEDVDEQPVQDLALNVDNMFQDDDYDAFDSDVDEAPTAKDYLHEMHDDVQPNYVVDSHADYTIDSNIIPYDQYVKDNAVPVVQSSVSSVPNDAYMMILNDIYEPSAQCVLFEHTGTNVFEIL
ncbi:hypothetical protein Tco_0941659 [Tanacetum coccineum]|uniref:Uncharacterized protein n=1 Tax=Tanacetum coccineum TaxID=301880 RepID=A0ABQ5DSF2_9ASTR